MIFLGITLCYEVAFPQGRLHHPPSRCRSKGQRKRNEQSTSIEQSLDVWALHGLPGRLEIARDHCSAPRIRVRLLPSHLLIQVLSPFNKFYYLFPSFIRHGIGSSREPEDLFLFTRNPSGNAFEASYIVDAPAPATNKTVLCMQCANGKPTERDRLFDVGGVMNHLSAK